jgi:hypothetical protein
MFRVIGFLIFYERIYVWKGINPLLVFFINYVETVFMDFSIFIIDNFIFAGVFI